MHQVQNSLLLCLSCHSAFDLLKTYVEEIGDKFVVKAVKGFVDEKDPDDFDMVADWAFDLDRMESARTNFRMKFQDERLVVNWL